MTIEEQWEMRPDTSFVHQAKDQIEFMYKTFGFLLVAFFFLADIKKVAWSRGANEMIICSIIFNVQNN